MRKTIALSLALVAFAAACGSDDEQDEAGDAATTVTETVEEEPDSGEVFLEDLLTLELREQNDSGITGDVGFSPTTEGAVVVEIELEGSDGGPHPAHIHPGTCADLDPSPQWPLADVVDGRSRTTIEVRLGELTAQQYAVNVHESPENADVYVACGDIGNQ